MLSARTSLLCVSILLLTLSAHRATAQSLLPQADGEKSRFSAVVEMPKGYLSGVCVMLVEGDCVKGSFFNDFGISFFDFAYSRTKDKVKLLSVQPMMDKWYIRKVLRRDLRQLLHCLDEGGTEYHDVKHKLSYQFTPLTGGEPNDSEDEIDE